MLIVAEFCISVPSMVIATNFKTCWVWVSLIFLRLSFFPEWIRLIQRTVTRIRYRNHRTSSSSSHSNRSDFLIQLHPPSKDFVRKDFVTTTTTPLETPYQHNGFQFPKMGFDLDTPTHTKSESQATIITDAMRPGSARPASQRSNTLVKKDKAKKINVEDILAMRRLEQGSQQGTREYPGIQPTKIAQITGEREGIWPTYQFGEGGNGWNQV